jgi:hypothetical protein
MYFIFGAIAGYCFLRVVFYPLLKFLVDESDLYSNPKYKKSMNIFYHARLYPWPTWDKVKRRNWVKAWWKFAILGLTSFIITGFAMFLYDSIR